MDCVFDDVVDVGEFELREGKAVAGFLADEVFVCSQPREEVPTDGIVVRIDDAGWGLAPVAEKPVTLHLDDFLVVATDKPQARYGCVRNADLSGLRAVERLQDLSEGLLLLAGGEL